jgi:hypothetical protein
VILNRDLPDPSDSKYKAAEKGSRNHAATG